MKKFLRLTLALSFLISSCAVKDQSASREPAQINGESVKRINTDVTKLKQMLATSKDEIRWIVDKSHPNTQYFFPEKQKQKEYLAFLKTYGLSNTFETMNRFSNITLSPLTPVEVEFLKNLNHYSQLIDLFKKSQKAKVEADKKALKQRAAALEKQKQLIKAYYEMKKNALRVRVSTGKPSWVYADSWVAGDVATALREKGIHYQDVILYFENAGFRSLVNNKKLSFLEMEARYRAYSSQGLDYVELLPPEIERIRAYSQAVMVERSKMMMDLIKNGESIANYTEVLLAQGFSAEEIMLAQDENSPAYQAAYQKGKIFNEKLQGYIASSMPVTLAVIQTEKDMGYIDEATYQTRYNEEKEATDRYLATTRNSWSASLGSFGTNVINTVDKNKLSVVIPVLFPAFYYQGAVDNREQYAKDSLTQKIQTYGSAVKYYEFQADVEKKYQFRPLAEPLEFAANIAKGAGNAIAKVVAFVDVAREISPVPLSTIDYYNLVTAQKFEAKDGYFYKTSEVMQHTIEYMKPINHDFDEKFHVTVVPQVLGQMTVQLGTGILTGGGSWILSTAVSTGVGVAQSGTDSYQEALKYNATAEQRKIAARVGALTGLIDAIPMGNFMKPLSQAGKASFFKAFLGTLFKGLEKRAGAHVALQITRGILNRQMVKYGGKILVGQITEGTTELTQKKINDYTAMLTYDPQRKALVIGANDMQEFWGGVVGGTLGGGIEIAVEAKAEGEPQAQAIEDQVSQMMSPLGLLNGKAAASVATAQQNQLFLQIMILDQQIKKWEDSNRKSINSFQLQKAMIEKQNALMTQALADKNIDSNFKAFIDNKRAVNKTAIANIEQELFGVRPPKVDPAPTSNRIFEVDIVDRSLVAALKLKVNETIWTKLNSDKDYADAFIEVLKDRPDLQKNVIKFLMPQDSKRRAFFNDMMAKVVDAKIDFLRQQMIENTRRVLEQPDCGI